MHCIYCGKPLSPNAPACGNCGRGIDSNAAFGGSSCPRCHAPLAKEARFCGNCGGILTAYAPPEGFRLDPKSLRYYRSEQPGPNDPVQWVTWFDPTTGAYEQVSYPVEQPQQTAPAQAAASVPGPQPPHMQIPEGYVPDPGSGLYYIAAPGRDPATGANGTLYTWFTPATGEYRQSFHPAGPAAQSARAPGTPPQNAAKRKAGVLPVVLPLFALLVGAGIAFFQAGGFAQLSGPAAVEIPQGIPIRALDSADMPQLQSMSDSPAPEDSEAAVSLDKAIYSPGEAIEVTVQGVTQEMWEAGAFVAIYVKEEEHSGYMSYDYPSPGDDRISFSAPTSPGSYEVRLYRQDYVYTDESFVTLASFTVEGSSALALNMELMEMLGSANAKLQEINGDTCRSSYLMYGDGMVADYTGSAAPYPVAFWLSGSSSEEIMERWAQESDGGYPVEGKNIWSDQCTISMIEAGGEGLHTVFEGAAAITPEAMAESFTLIDDLYYLSQEEQGDYVYEYDIWEGEYLAGEYTIIATFYENNGERELLNAKIWL